MSDEAPCNIVMRYHETVNAMQHNYYCGFCFPRAVIGKDFPTHHQSVIEAKCVYIKWDLRPFLPLI